MFVVKQEKDELLSLPAEEIDLDKLRNLSPLAIEIMKLISENAMYPAQIAKSLKEHEQKIYYHIRNLERKNLIKVVKEENKQGAVARYYKLCEPAFVLRFKKFDKTHKFSKREGRSKEFLEPFIVDGKFDALIVVGSPDPHGPDKARSRDGYYGMDLALFLGTFLNYVPSFNVKLDTETREEDLKQNLIIIGGPIVNKVMEKFNDDLPIKFKEKNIYSTLSKQEYPSDEIGIIVKAKNPFCDGKQILVVAGKRHAGTRAAIIAFLKHFSSILDGNVHKKKIIAKVVEGIDLDSDGLVDDVEIRE
ncbi:S-layer protein [Candidatus Woesearchaeota archaeon]|jgi:DNA-binding transcriptional ArsR family regulator|nr:S-layer protein [Candidatus Woesearchaeota archaeon]MBT6518668.1 S-layer protein [Candidatus Woesearchaeota archaeon]MBT7368858.1 S-layer protein [Candidatus Woesearchaeota archaeon]